ncbi:MAG: LysR substrate-binding domain-containing protein [Hyphomicrobium sp.]
MTRKLPPLNALRAFEAAARHESLTRAADELNVTHAAISRHIRSLESSLRVALFERTGRGVILTEAGRTLAGELTVAFDRIATATGQYTSQTRRRQRLAITCDVPFAAYWLVPRLGRFTSAHPGIDLILDPNVRPIDFSKGEADIGIRFGIGPWPGVTSVKLFDADVTVVCSPKLLARGNIKSPADLPSEALIQELDRTYWRRWLEAAGVAGQVKPAGPTLLADLTVSAAEAGHGFALTDRLIVVDALMSKRLVVPFPLRVSCKAYHLVHGASRPLSKAAHTFRRWLLDELAVSLAQLESLEAKTNARADTEPRPLRSSRGAAGLSAKRGSKRPPA